jgi:hypothetical protein
MKKVAFILTLVLSLVVFSNLNAETDKANSSGTVCDNEYVLCTSAPCVPDPSNPDSKAICSCDVNKGKNFGMSQCGDRTTVTDTNGVTKALSTYSFAQASSKPVLSCPAGKPWTNCLDQPCIVDQMNPLKAICTCEIVRDLPFVTYGGECNVLTCDNAYWSAATSEAFRQGSLELAKSMGLEENPAQFCAGMEPLPSK